MAREEQRSTLVRPPPADPDKAPIENVLDVTEVGVLGTVSLVSRAHTHTIRGEGGNK